MNMHISDYYVDLVKEWEGCKLKPYKDSGGKLTIGIGHLIKPGEKFDTITIEKAIALYRVDVAIAEKAVNEMVEVPLTQYQFDALVDFAFNAGVGAFKSSTLLKKINGGWHDEITNEFRRWIYVNGKVVKGLKNRREKEIALWNKK